MSSLAASPCTINDFAFGKSAVVIRGWLCGSHMTEALAANRSSNYFVRM